MNDSPIAASRRADMAALVFAITFPTLVTWVYFVLLAETVPAVQHSAYSVGKVIQFAFPVVWVMAVHRQRLQLKTPQAAGVGEGLGIGLLILIAMLVLYHGLLKPAGHFAVADEPIRQKVAGFGLDRLWKYAGLAAFYALVHSFLEEYYWRWFVFGQLRRLMPLWVAVLVSSLGFMAHHVILLSVYFGWFTFAMLFFSASVAVGGVIWAWLYHHTHSLYGPWASHLLVDAGIFIIGYDVVRNTFT